MVKSKYLHPNWISGLSENLPQLREVSFSIEDAYNWGSIWRKQYQSGMVICFTNATSLSLICRFIPGLQQPTYCYARDNVS
jgi:hypothetical protein